MNYTPAAAAMIQHRYGYSAGSVDSDLFGDQVVADMFGAVDQPRLCPCGRPCGPATCGRGRGLKPCGQCQQQGGKGCPRCPYATAGYGSLPTQGTGTMELQPVVGAGIDTGTVQLVTISLDPDLSELAEEGIEMGFAEFMKEFAGSGR